MRMEALFTDKFVMFANIVGVIGGIVSFFILNPHIWIVSIVVVALCGVNLYNCVKDSKKPTQSPAIST
jgi:uncharacterized membrane protein